VDRKFIAKLAPWPYGHYNQVIFDGLDDIIDDIVTEDFEDGSFSQIYTDDHTTASFQQHYRKCFTFLDVHQLNMIEHNAYGFVPSSSELGSALVPAMLPISPLALVPSQAPTSDDFVAVDELMLPQIIKLSEDLRWTTRSAPDGNSHCQSILADLPVDHPWSLIVRSLKTTMFGSLITGRYGNTMRVVKLWPFRHQFITQCFLEGLSRIGWSYQDCKNIDRKHYFFYL
jgi:hypothetical protein